MIRMIKGGFCKVLLELQILFNVFIEK